MANFGSEGNVDLRFEAGVDGEAAPAKEAGVDVETKGGSVGAMLLRWAFDAPQMVQENTEDVRKTGEEVSP